MIDAKRLKGDITVRFKCGCVIELTVDFVNQVETDVIAKRWEFSATLPKVCNQHDIVRSLTRPPLDLAKIFNTLWYTYVKQRKDYGTLTELLNTPHVLFLDFSLDQFLTQEV